MGLRDFTQKLPVKLTEMERNQRAREAASLSHRLGVHKDHADQVWARLEAERKAMEARQKACASASETGVEDRDVGCIDEVDGVSERIITVRQDTGDIIGAREMDSDERAKFRQGELFGPRHVPRIRTDEARDLIDRAARARRSTEEEARDLIDNAPPARRGVTPQGDTEDRPPAAPAAPSDNGGLPIDPSAPVGSPANPRRPPPEMADRDDPEE